MAKMPKKQFSTGKDVSGHPLLLVIAQSAWINWTIISHVKEWIVKYGIDFGAVISSKAEWSQIYVEVPD